MEFKITAAQELVSSKKSIVLKPTDQGNAKVVLVEHYISPSGKKEKRLKPALAEVDAPSKTYKRKSFELVDSKMVNEQISSGKRRRSVQLGGFAKTLETVAPVVRDVGKTQHSITSFGVSYATSGDSIQRTNGDAFNALHAQSMIDSCQSTMEVSPSRTHENKMMDCQKYDLQYGEWDNKCYGQDTVLLPEDWLDKRCKDDLQDSNTHEPEEHKSLFSVFDPTEVSNTGKCKSLFATYHLNKVCKSIIDEM